MARSPLVLVGTLLLVSTGVLGRNLQDSDFKPVPRIVNGDDASVGDFPFLVLILATSSYSADGEMMNQCGGSILSDRIILTAAHCVVRDIAVTDSSGSTTDETFFPSAISVTAGEGDQTADESSEQKMKASGIIVHEDYDGTTVANDIALIILEKALTLNAKVAEINLPEGDASSFYSDGAAVTVAGWGTTETGEVSDTIKSLDYEVKTDSDCKDVYSDLLDGMLCTGKKPMTNKRAGTGDSGGPLFTKNGTEWLQLALVSWGPSEITETSWDVNSNVNYYRDWITTAMDDAFTAYEIEFQAKDSGQTININNMRNRLYNVFTFVPETSTKYVSITIKSGDMKEMDFVMIYDGKDMDTAKMIAQLSGTLKEKTYTASTTAGLTLVIMTSSADKSTGLSFEIKQVGAAGAFTETTCAEGYARCKDNKYCVSTQLFCDGEGGECIDYSDEDADYCKEVKKDDGDKGDGDKGDGDKDDGKGNNTGNDTNSSTLRTIDTLPYTLLAIAFTFLVPAFLQ